VELTGRCDAIDGEEITNKIPDLEERARATQQDHQMCPTGKDFKHFCKAKHLRISSVRQGLVNHAGQGLVNHAIKSCPGDSGLTSLLKPKRKGSG
jgi:hypothetical protein